MISAILWYLAISLIGWLSLPLVFRVFPALPDRGYAFARTCGLLVWGYVFWMLASFGVLRNELGGLLFAILVLIALSGWALRERGLDELASWLREHRRQVILVEVLFLVSFAWMALVRSANPEIQGTEKPMELAFINAILHSPEFPPHDPWLSGYAISYYYFGYVMVAMLARLTGTPGSIAFNLGVTMVFALSAVGAYGIVYNLLASAAIRRVARRGGQLALGASRGLALLGPLFILLAGNMAGFLEVLHSRGIFWQQSPTGELTSSFWPWLDLRELSQPPVQSLSWNPTRYLWWWRASRVLQDYDFAGAWREVIDEFPAFSYLLADLHPHVLAMPFAFLAMAVVQNLALGGVSGNLRWLRRRIRSRHLAWVAVIVCLAGLGIAIWGVVAGAFGQAALGALALLAGASLFAILPPSTRALGLAAFTQDEESSLLVGPQLNISSLGFASAALCLGGLGFLNTWDFPFYVALFGGAYFLVRMRETKGRYWEVTRESVWVVVALLIAGILLYLPFYLGFSSQASGILPSLVYFARGVNLWVMFAPLFIPIFVYLLTLWSGHSGTWRWQGFAITAGFILLLGLLSGLLAAAITLVPAVSGLFLANLAAPGLGPLLWESIIRRLRSPGGWITLLLLLGAALGLILRWVRSQSPAQDNAPSEQALVNGKSRRTRSASSPSIEPYPVSPQAYTLLIILLGGLLVLGPEFFYLRDLFGWRINTIFKFYYQAWLLLGIAAAYASAVLIISLRGIRGLAFSLCLILVMATSLTYTVLGVWDKTNGFNPPTGFTLDGTAHLVSQAPDEMAAIAWVSQAQPGVVAEAVGGSYSIFGRVSTLSGQPTVLGWDFHETQWRGGGLEIGTRQSDMMQLYCTRNWDEADLIIRQYQIRYIIVGSLERTAYTPEVCPGGLNDAKFIHNLPVAFQQGNVTVYITPWNQGGE